MERAKYRAAPSTNAAPATALATITLPTAGVCCATEAAQLEDTLAGMRGVYRTRVLVSAGCVTVTYDPALTSEAQIAAAVQKAGFAAAPQATGAPRGAVPRGIARVVGWSTLGVVALIVLVAALGERLGLFDRALDRLPWWVPALAIVLGGWPVFRGVLAAARRGRVTSHTLMTVGMVAAAAVGQWTTAALIVFFMRFADWLEELTTTRSRQALRQLVALQPATAHVLRDGREINVPVEQVAVDDLVLVRPGERIPVDGVVVEGQAPVDQGSITGESVPVDKAPGDAVFAATVAQAGFLKVRATRVGQDTTFARIVRLVEEAETQRAPVQRFADRFATYYLPGVLGIALGTYALTGAVMNAVAVVVVACACAITLATPVVVLASVGNAARRGLLVKGGIVLERLARIDTVVMDKTGTVTFGTPHLTDVVPLDQRTERELLCAVAGLESRSEHPLARAIVTAARQRGIEPPEPTQFTVLPGQGLIGTIDGREWAVGTARLLVDRGIVLPPAHESWAQELEAAGKTVFFAAADGTLRGLIAVADTLRPDVRAALAELQRLGIRRLLLLTGDSEHVAAAIARELGVGFWAGLLPEDKIAIIRALQAEGHVVLMVGDGINDAPALAQADVGVAMGTNGTDVALEAADVALLRDDWLLIPASIRLGRRAARAIRQNLGFTALYNLVGIGLAAVGLLPPVWAAAAQSVPDVAIMLNSARLLHTKQEPRPSVG